MTDKEAVINAVLSRPPSAAEVLRELLDQAERGRLELARYSTHTPQELVSGHLEHQFVQVGPQEVTLVLKVIGDG